MRLRRVRLSDGVTSTAFWDAPRERWVALVPALKLTPDATLEPAADDLVAFLAHGEAARDAALRLGDALSDEPLSDSFELDPLLPFAPKLLRAYPCWRAHWEQAARGLMRRNVPLAGAPVALFERVTGRTFPPLSPGRAYESRPSFYIGNHLTIEPADTTVPRPDYSNEMDLELELAMVIARDVRDATGSSALDAIGGFTILNDLSARDTQWEEYRQGLFGPLGKTKSFATVMASEVVTADEVLPHIESLAASIRVNGETWATTSTAGMAYTPEQLVAHASLSERVQAGELISTGTMPDGCGLELGRSLNPGDEVELDIERVGSLRCRIG